MSHKLSSYSGLKGHLASLETTDRETAITVASRLNDLLEISGTRPIDRSSFAEHIDSPNDRMLSETRPNVGDYAVSAALAQPWEIEALTDEPQVYLVLAQTRNAARDYPDLNGPEKLQEAVREATEDIIK